MKTLLITGINGYLGSNLAIRYKDKYQIIGLEYDTSNLSRIKDYNFTVFSTKDGISENLFNDFKIDAIIHTATLYGRNNELNIEIFKSNLYLPLLLLEKAIANKCQLFINTDTALKRLTSPYSISKKQFKDWLKFFSFQKQIKVVNLKLEHFYGPATSDSNF